MKTTFLLYVLAFFAICNTYSQQEDFEFNRLNTRKLTLKGQSISEIYSVSYAEVEEAASPEYTKLRSELEELIADSISKKANYDKALASLNDISIIKSKVIDFINSRESFGKKATFLKEAQILASKHNIQELFYSDSEINKDMKAGFLLLTLNLEYLEVHLNKVLLRLDHRIIAPIRPNYISTEALREKIATTQKKQAKDTKHANGYMLQHSMVPPEDISGSFVVVNSYYVINMPTKGFLKNQLIPKKTVLNLGIAKTKLHSNKEKMLIQNKRTKEMYLVDNNFIDNFSIKS